MRSAAALSGEAPVAGAARVATDLAITVVMPVATQRGGAERTLVHAVAHSRGSGVRWRVVFLEEGPMADELAALGAATSVVAAGRLRDARRVLGTVRRLSRLIRGSRTDVVIGWMSKAHLYSAPAARIAGVPAIWFQHGLPAARDPIDRLCAALPAAGVLACSRFVADAQRRIAPRRPTTVVYPGVEMDAEHGDPAALRAEAGVPPNAVVIGLVGRLQRWKGVHVLIDALPTVLEHASSAHLVVVGGDHPLELGYREALVVQAERLGVRHRVHLAGYQPQPRRWMAAMDVVVHASDREPFGLVVLEAMACGRPLVAGASGGPAEIVTDGVDGLLAPYGDAASLARQIIRYVDDPAFAAAMAKAGRERARDFAPERFAATVVGCAATVATPRGAR